MLQDRKRRRQQKISKESLVLSTIEEVSEAKSPCDKVRGNVEYWESIDKSSFAVKLIKRGLTIPFADKGKVLKACKVDITERNTSIAKKRCLRKEVKNLLDMDVIERVPRGTKVYENYIFGIKKPSGKLRIIFDMKVLNKEIKLPKLKMFRFSFAYQELLINSFACKIDLSDAYWHVGVNLNFKRFLSFKFDNIIYQWKVMPFGLKTAPYLFCKLMGTFVRHMRVKFKVIVYFYMDDLFIVGPSKEITSHQVRLVIKELQLAGFAVNIEKSIMEPMQIINFIGVQVNMELKLLSPSNANIRNCIFKVKKFVKGSEDTLKNLQSLLGTLNFVAGFMQFGRIRLSPLFAYIPYFSNERKKPIPVHLKESLRWWSNSKNYLPVKIPDFNLPVVTVFTDASNLGWGAQIIWPDKSKVNINGVWSENEVEDHINIKELRTVLLALKSCSKKLNKVVIKIFSDNRSTVLWIKKESSSRSIKAREIIYELLKMKYKNDLILRPIYVKGKENAVADGLSRSLQFNAELAITQVCFDKLCRLASCLPEIDLFADSENRKCSKFFSASPAPNSTGIDALSQNWDAFRCAYAFPPDHLLNRTIYKFISSKCNKLLLIFHRSNFLALKKLEKLKANLLEFSFRRKDFVIPQSMTPLALDPSKMIGCLL